MPELLDDVEDGHLLLDAEARLVPQLGVHVRLADHVEAHLERLLRRRVLLHPQQRVALALVNLKCCFVRDYVLCVNLNLGFSAILWAVVNPTQSLT